MARKYGKVDLNQKAIVSALRQCGCTVTSTASIGNGFPDISVGIHGVNWLLEVKQPGEKLTEAEKRFHTTWRGQCAVVYSVDDALRTVGVKNGK